MDVGRYRIDSLVTQTPLGALYMGTPHAGGGPVLVYRMRAAVGDDPRRLAKLQAQARLLREARVPGLPKLLDAGQLPDATLYAVYAAGGVVSLVQAIARHQQTGSSTDALALEIGQRLGKTLARAHAEGVFHLSLSPGQVLLAEDDQAEERIGLLGLGLATLLGRTTAVGWDADQLTYAAPEQRTEKAPDKAGDKAGDGGGVSAASDVYALGILLGQLLRDRADLRVLVRQMCSLDPSARPSMADVAAQLQVTQPTALPPRAPPGARPQPQRAVHGVASQAKAADLQVALTQADAPVAASPAAGPTAAAAAVVPAARGASGGAEPSGSLGDRPTAVSPEETAADGDRIGARFGNFRVVRKLGEGGMGIVYEAEHEQIGRRAAVKILHGRYAETDAYARRFLNEARAVNIVRHPGLVEIFEFGKLPDGTLYYIMEYLQGESLERRIEARGGPFPQDEAVNIALQVARALAAAHDKHIVHRDLKPGNIMFVPDPVNPGLDWVKVLDFGIAKVRGPADAAERAPGDLAKTEEQTGQGTRLGTPLYMAPEQHGGAEDADGRADVFSLGVVLYEMLAGKTPFRNNSLSLLIAKPAPIESLNSKVSPVLATLVRRMMAMESDERPTMRQVEEQLGALLQTPRARGRLVAMAALSAVLLATVVGALLWFSRSPSPSELRARALSTLQGALAQGDAGTQVLAATVIGQSHDLDARTLLAPLLTASAASATLREASVRALAELGDADSQPQLLRMLDAAVARSEGGGGGLVVTLASALAQLQHPRGFDVLRRVLQEGDDLSRVQAALSLLERGDFSGSELLWTRIGHGSVTARTLTQVLGRLALSGDERARARLGQEFATRAGGEGRILVAYALSRLGDDAARSYLRSVATGSVAGDPGDALLATRLLFALGETPRAAAQIGAATANINRRLSAIAVDPTQPEARRELALAALGDSEDVRALGDVGRVLRERGASPRLQVAAAGAVLALLAGEPARQAEQSLAWARSALSSGLSSDSPAARELAVLALGDLQDLPSLPNLRDRPDVAAGLRQALSDTDPRVRRQAALQLAGRTGAPWTTLSQLRKTLTDADRGVRLAGAESIGRVLRTLKGRPDRAPGERDGPLPVDERGAEASLRADLQQQADAGSELERVVKNALLFQLGERSRRPQLLSGLASKDPLVRKVTVQLLVGSGEAAAVEKALTDPERAVRLAAALQLAEAGQRQGVAVLRSVVAAGELDGLVAYRALRRLGEACDPPPGLAVLLATGDLVTRYAVVEGLRDLPLAVALPLLQRASIDPASVVRRRVVAVAATFYRALDAAAKDARLLLLIAGLRGDPDVIVRAFVRQILVELLPATQPAPSGPASERSATPGEPSQPAPRGTVDAAVRDGAAATAPADLSVAAGPEKTPSSATGTPGATAATLVLEGEDGVRVTIDRQGPTLLSDKPLPLAPGRHSLRYLGGGQDVTLSPGQTLRVRIPVRLGDQLLQDGRDALLHKDLGRAQDSLERARRLAQRGGRGPQPLGMQADVAFELAHVYEARGQLREALAEYNRCLAIPSGSRRPELNSALAGTLTRLSGRAGRIQIFTRLDGRCQMTQELLLPPGEQIVSIGKGQTRTVFSQLGSTNKLMACD